MLTCVEMASLEVIPIKTDRREANAKEMGCNASKPPEAMDYKNVPRFNPNYPFPKPPDDTKEELCGHENFVPIDNNAKSVPSKDKERYQTLLPRLLQGTNNDVQKVRAIYSYTGSINYNDPQVTQAKEGDTPTYYIKMIKEKKGDVPTFFTILCRRAGIPCVILDGLGKGKNYVPGMSEKDMRSKWNAVHVNDNWRPVHVEWGHQDNGGKNKDKKDDFYFLTDPDRFVISCFPDDYQWQLLAEPLTKKEWLNLPNFRPEFYELHMQLVKPKSGLIRAVKGKAEVEISVPPHMMDKIRVSYGLQYKGAISKNDRDQNNTSREIDSNRAMESSRGMESSLKDEGKVERPKSVPPRLERYVFLNRKPSRFNFTMTLPVAGKYLFEITGNHMDEEGSSQSYGAAKTLLCQFRVLSENDPLDEDCEPYPDAPEFGWGPTPHCTRLGITPITHLEGIIFINPKEKKDIKFRLSGDLDFRTSLSHNYLPLDQLKDMSSWRQPRDDEMIVTVEIPEEGVFGLKIEAARANSGQFFEIVNYLLRQHSRGGVSEKVRSKMLRAKLNYAIEHGPTEKALKDAMDMFDCYNVPDQGEMARAQERLEHYWTIKKELNFSCRRRNNGVLDKWIKAGRSSKFEAELKEDISQAEDMKEKLGKLHGYLHPIAKMQPKTIQEIRTYQHPKPVTKDVMTATYILLGERKEGLQDWTNIQVLMARTGKDSLQKRILDRRPEDVNEKDVEVVDVILEPHNINEAREASAGTATFYRWAKEFVHFTRSPDSSYHKEGILDRDTYRETYGISVNRHHEHIEFERHKYDSPRVNMNTGRSPEGKEDTKADQTAKSSHQDPMEQNEELIANYELENSSAPKDTQYQNNSPRRFQSKVTPNKRKPEPSPAYKDPGLKRDRQTDKSSPKNSLDENPIHRETDISKPKPKPKHEDKLPDNTGNHETKPAKGETLRSEKQIEYITEKRPNDEDIEHRDATPEKKDEVTSKKTIPKENDQLQKKPIIPAQQREESKKPVQERSRKDRERKPETKNEVGEKKDVPKQEENQQKDKDDRQEKEAEKLKPDRHEQDKKKKEKQEMKNSEEKKEKKDDKEKKEYEGDVKKEIKEKKEKEMIDKEREKMSDREKAAKLKKEKEAKEKTDREEREKNKQGMKEKEKERREKEKEDRLRREKEEKERKEKEKQELEKDAQIKKENDAKERKEKERQRREKEEQLKREKEEKEGKEKAEKQKKDREKKDKIEKEKQDQKEKKEKTEIKKPYKTSNEEVIVQNDKKDTQKKDKTDRDKRDKEEKERKEKEKEEKEKKEKEKERNDREKQLKEREEKDKRERLDKVNKERAKQEKEKEEREKIDKEEKEKKEKEAKQNKDKEGQERKEKKDKEIQQKEENDKREREEKQKRENKPEKENDPSVPVRSHSYYFFDLY